MSTAWAPPAPTPAPLSFQHKASFADSLRCEWTKVRTVRATFWCLAIAVLLGVGLVDLVAAISASRYATDITVRAGWNPVQRSLRPLLLAQLVFAVFGVITVTAEYSSGMIRTSLAAVPKRGRFTASKLIVFAVVALIAGEVISFASFLSAQAIFSGQAPTSSLSDHLVLRAVIGAGLYLALLGLLGAAIGLIFRHAAAGIGVMVAIMLVLPAIVLALPSSWSNPIDKYWPTEAGQQIYYLHRDSHTVAAWTGFGVMALFAAVVIGIAYTLLQGRDA